MPLTGGMYGNPANHGSQTMKHYQVTVSRRVRECLCVDVQANSQAEAEQMVDNIASNADDDEWEVFSHDEMHVMDVLEVEEKTESSPQDALHDAAVNLIEAWGTGNLSAAVQRLQAALDAQD